MVEISIIPFRHKYLSLLKEMLDSQNCQHISRNLTMKNLPKCGYITMMGSQPTAAGFLRKIEGGLTMIDGLTSNPYFGSEIRHESIKLVVDQLIKDAKNMKSTGILSFTQSQDVLKRSKTIGFEVLNDTMIVLKL